MLIDGYEIDMDHEDAYAEGMPNALYIEGEKRKIDADEGLSTYIGTKIVQGEPQTCQKDDHNSKVGDPGYKVVYKDGYISWSPKDVFEDAYRKTDGMIFGLAVEAMKKGIKVCFDGWPEHKFMFLSQVGLGKGYGLPDDYMPNRIYCAATSSLLKDQKIVSYQWIPEQTEILQDKWQIWER